MTERNSEQITGTISIGLLPQDNGQHFCQLSLSFSNFSREDIRCYGQTREHALAIALERLAHDYRQMADEQQNIPPDVGQRSQTDALMDRQFHVIVHYERIAEDESKFEAVHNTLMGNTIVENATIAVVEVDPDLPIEPLDRWT